MKRLSPLQAVVGLKQQMERKSTDGEPKEVVMKRKPGRACEDDEVSCCTVSPVRKSYLQLRSPLDTGQSFAGRR